jgi:acyl-CoA dehydrogenase
VRCHPFVLKEMTAARNPDRAQGVDDFDRALFGHVGFTISNAVRSFIMALTHARFTRVPVQGPTARYYQHIVRFSASFAFAVDVAMLTLGGYLKKKENLSARLGDVLSCMYLASMVLKHHENQGRPDADLPVVEWACRNLLYSAQEQLHSFLRNFPNRFLGGVMRLLILPRGLVYSAPSDRLSRNVADIASTPEDARDRLCRFIYTTLEPTNALGLLQEALVLAQTAEPIEKRIRVEGVKTGKISALDLPGQIKQAVAAGIISETEAASLAAYVNKVMDLINVDDFAPNELGMQSQPVPHTQPASVSSVVA